MYLCAIILCYVSLVTSARMSNTTTFSPEATLHEPEGITPTSTPTSTQTTLERRGPSFTQSPTLSDAAFSPTNSFRSRSKSVSPLTAEKKATNPTPSESVHNSITRSGASRSRSFDKNRIYSQTRSCTGARDVAFENGEDVKELSVEDVRFGFSFRMILGCNALWKSAPKLAADFPFQMRCVQEAPTKRCEFIELLWHMFAYRDPAQYTGGLTNALTVHALPVPQYDTLVDEIIAIDLGTNLTAESNHQEPKTLQIIVRVDPAWVLMIHNVAAAVRVFAAMSMIAAWFMPWALLPMQIMIVLATKGRLSHRQVIAPAASFVLAPAEGLFSGMMNASLAAVLSNTILVCVCAVIFHVVCEKIGVERRWFAWPGNLIRVCMFLHVGTVHHSARLMADTTTPGLVAAGAFGILVWGVVAPVVAATWWKRTTRPHPSFVVFAPGQTPRDTIVGSWGPHAALSCNGTFVEALMPTRPHLFCFVTTFFSTWCAVAGAFGGPGTVLVTLGIAGYSFVALPILRPFRVTPFTPAFMFCYFLVFIHSALDCGLPYKARGDSEFRWLGDAMTMSPPAYLAVEASLLLTVAFLTAAISIFDDVAHRAYHIETPTFHRKKSLPPPKEKPNTPEQCPEDVQRPWRRAQQRNVKEWHTAAEEKSFPFELCAPMMMSTEMRPPPERVISLSPFPVSAPIQLFPDTYRQRVVPNLPEHIREFYHGTSM